MKLLKDLFSLIKFCVIFFAIFLCIYILKSEDLNNLTMDLNADSMKRFIGDYIFYIFIISAATSVIFIGAMNKFSGRVSAAITIAVLTLAIILYPVYFLINNSGSMRHIKNELPFLPDISDKKFVRIDDYIVKAQGKLSNNAYGNVILIDSVYNRKIYFADSAYFSYKEISMSEAKELSSLNSIEEERKESVAVAIDDKSNRLSIISKNIAFGFNSIPLLSSIFKYIGESDFPMSAIPILYGGFFLIFLALYNLSLSLHSKKYKFHNILAGLFVYLLLQSAVNILVSKYHFNETDYNFFNIAILAYLASIFVIILSFILKKAFKT